MEKCAEFRFYEELNDFLPPKKRKKTFPFRFQDQPKVKEVIEALRVPPAEVDLILANGHSVGFDYRLREGDRLAVYPVFESLNIAPLAKLREKPLRRAIFILDVHLGKLAKWLRLLGFDAKYSNVYEDCEIVRLAAAEERIILTRDRRLLCAKAVTRGYWLRSVEIEAQLREVLERFDLYGQIRPFERCLLCNGPIEPVAKAEVLDRLEPRTAAHYHEFFQCGKCGKIYWKGSHYERMRKALEFCASGA